MPRLLLAGNQWIQPDSLPADPAELGESVGHVAGAIAAYSGVWHPDSAEEDGRTFTLKADGHALDRDLPATELEDREVLELVEVSADTRDGDTSTVTDVDDSEG